MIDRLSPQLLPGAPLDYVDWAARPGQWIKLSGVAQLQRAKQIGALVYYRPYPDDGDVPSTSDWANKVWDDMRLAGVSPDALVFRNEISPRVGNVQAYLQWRGAMRWLGYRGLCVYGSYGVGNPDYPIWPQLWQAFGADLPDALDLHEYFDLTVAGCEPDYVLRHTHINWPGTFPLFIGELGSDKLEHKDGTPLEDLRGRRGWQDHGKLSPDDYAAQLEIYRAAVSPRVRAAFVFGDGAPAWYDFATRGTAAERVYRFTAVAGTPARPAQPAPTQVAPGKGDHVEPILLDQGPNNLCGQYSIEMYFAGAGHDVSAQLIYQQVHGEIYEPSQGPGKLTSFPELLAGVRIAAQLAYGDNWQAHLQLYRDGYVYDLNTFDQVVRDGWCVIAGVQMPGESYGHFFDVYGIDGDSFLIADSYHKYDGDNGRQPITVVHQAMVNNWTGPTGPDAIAFKLV